MNIIKHPKFELSIVKSNGNLCWRTVKRKSLSTHTAIRAINPFPYWFKRLKWHITHAYIIINKLEYKQCQGCGEGISIYKIRDPNYGHGNEYYNCCKGCVNFYDFRFSAMKIIKWENKKAVCKKWR